MSSRGRVGSAGSIRLSFTESLPFAASPAALAEIGATVNGCNIVVGVDDVDGLMARGIELGGTEALPATDFPGIGRGGYLLDPDNNIFGLISPVMSDGTVAMGEGAEA